MRKYTNHQQDNWPELVPLAEYAYNTTKTRGTDFTPYQVVYSKTPTIHAALGEPSQAAIDKIRKVTYKKPVIQSGATTGTRKKTKKTGHGIKARR